MQSFPVPFCFWVFTIFVTFFWYTNIALCGASVSAGKNALGWQTEKFREREEAQESEVWRLRVNERGDRVKKRKQERERGRERGRWCLWGRGRGERERGEGKERVSDKLISQMSKPGGQSASASTTTPVDLTWFVAITVVFESVIHTRLALIPKLVWECDPVFVEFVIGRLWLGCKTSKYQLRRIPQGNYYT